MPFSEKIRDEVKRRAHFTCCWCRDRRNTVEVHHVVPQSQDGPDTFDNAAPLCPSCHRLYGNNPDLRKEVRARRDLWYEICAGMSVGPTTKPKLKKDEMSLGLKVLYQKRKELTLAGNDTRVIETEILDLRRALRQGPQLHPGEYLADGRYELVEVMGQGGFATVWKAWDDGENRLVAVKVLHGHFSHDRSRRERFFRGARKMAELTHKHIVRVLDVERDDEGFHFFVMEHLDGGNFEQAVLDGRLTEPERIRVLLEVGDALAYAHAQSVVHRDVKPSNVLLAADGTAKLTDFDLVRADDTTGMTRTQAMMGTLLFAAPETLETAGKAGPPADVYSLGATAVFALTGSRLPAWFYRTPERAVGELSCEKRLKEVLGKAMAFAAGERFASSDELCRAIKEATAPQQKPKPPKVEPALEELFRWIDTPKDGRVELWREIPAGEGWIGESDRRRRVKVDPFLMAVVPVTNAQYQAFKPKHTFAADEARHPVVKVSWDDAVAFCRWLGETCPWAHDVRLPTEEEWEYACRAGTETAYWSGDTEADLAWVGWYSENAGRRMHRVGEKEANPWGLYDMHGNVWEWTATAKGSNRVSRGGSWLSDARDVRAAYRLWCDPLYGWSLLGFRLARGQTAALNLSNG